MTEAKIEELIESLTENLEKKLSLDRGIQCRNLKETQRLTKDGELVPYKITLESDPISGKELNNFRFIIEEYIVCVNVYFKENMNFVAHPKFLYSHHSGGANGYRLNFHIVGKVGDDWTKFKIEVD